MTEEELQSTLTTLGLNHPIEFYIQKIRIEMNKKISPSVLIRNLQTLRAKQQPKFFTWK